MAVHKYKFCDGVIMRKIYLFMFLILITQVYVLKGAEFEKTQANLHILDGDYEKAIIVLENSDNTDVESYFLLGEAHYYSGNYNEAAKYYENVIAKEESASKARYRLMQIYKKTDNKEKYNKEYEILKNSIDNDEILKEIDKSEKEISINKGKPSYYVYTGYIYNSNVNSGVDKNTINGVPVPDNQKKKSDNGLLVNFGVNYNYLLESSSYITPKLDLNVENYFKYTKESNYNGRLGVDYNKFSDKYYLNVPLSVSGKVVDGEKENIVFSGGVNFKYLLFEKTILTNSIEISEKKNYISNYKGEVLELNVYFDTFLENNNVIKYGIRYEDNFYDKKLYASTTIALEVEYTHKIKEDLIMKIGYESEVFNKYKESEDISLDKQDNTKHELSVRTTKKLEMFDINLDVIYMKNNSNLDIYEYDNFKLMLGLSKNF